MFVSGPGALGYLYQARYALLLLLRSSDDAAITLERVDDVAFEEDGTPIQLVQTKHHIALTASLSDASSDLWKTLRAWSIATSNQTIDLTRVSLALVTTATAQPDSVASKLRPSRAGGRDVTGALHVLRRVAEESVNIAIREAYGAFMALEEETQRLLLNAIQVLDTSPAILDTRDEIVRSLELATRPQFVQQLCERLEGWWFMKVIEHLMGSSTTV